MLLLQIIFLSTLATPTIGANRGPAGAGPTPDADEPREISWYSGTYESATLEAGRRGKPLLVYFWMDGSEHCTRLFQDTLQKPEAAQALRDYIVFSAKATEPSGAQLVQRFGIRTLPTMLFLRPDGSPDEAILGNMALTQFVPEVQRIQTGQDTISDLRRRLQLNPGDLDLRFKLADKLQFVGAATESQGLIDSIKRDDPKGKTVIAAQLLLYDVMGVITGSASDASDPATYDLKPMYTHLPSVQPEPVLFEGWQWVATIEGQRGKRTERRRALMKSWPHTAQNFQMNWGRELVGNFWDMRSELTKKEKLFAVKVAELAANRAVELMGMEEPPPAMLGEGFVDDPKGFVADQLDGLACAYYMNGKRRKALETSRRSLELDPNVPAHQAFLDHFENREK